MKDKLADCLLSETPDAVILLDPAGAVLHWNMAAERLFGYEASDAMRRPLVDLIGTAGQQASFHRVLQAAERGELHVDEGVCRRRDGSKVHVNSSTKALRGDDGALLGFIVTKKDVTPLKVSRDMKLVQTQYRDLLEHTPDAILIVNATGHIVLTNSRAERLFGYPREALLGQAVEMLLPPHARELHLAHRAQFLEQPRARSMGVGLELYGQRRDGEEVPVEISLSPLSTDEGPMVMCAVRDITERQETRRRTNQMFRALLECAPDAMVVVDPTGRIVLANSQTLSLFGWKREELLGQPVEMLMPERFRNAHPAHRESFLRQPKVRTMGAGLSLWGLRRDGMQFPVEISLSPIESEEGLLTAAAIRDATERHRVEETLQEANRLKSEFLANMSHELRTPLNGILGFSELLYDERPGPLNAKQKEYLHDVLDCGRHLLQLINDVLDLSKVEAGHMELHPELFHVRDAFGSVCTMVSAMAYKKRVRLDTHVGQDLDTVTLDPQKFKQILFNLLSNAVKFSKAGSKVEVNLDRLQQESLRLQVRDWGVGIAPADLERIFLAFQQLESSESRHHVGTGLGLTLTRRLVDLQGGHIEVASELGSGTTFTVTLPGALS